MIKKHSWKFENGSIKKEQLKDITNDFKRVLPFLRERNRLTGLDFHWLWSAFRGGKYSQEFIFGTYNTEHQSVESSSRHNEACQAFLAIAKKHLRHSIHIESDQSDTEWRKGVSLCQNVLGHSYDLIDVTENGKLRYKTWELPKHAYDYQNIKSAGGLS